MASVLAHITGPSGSGKSHLLSEIQSAYPNLATKDLDEFDEIATEQLKLPHKWKTTYTDEMLKSLLDRRQLLLNKWIKKQKSPIVLGGHHIEGKGTLDIPTSNKLMLDTPAWLSTWRGYRRSQTEEPAHRRRFWELPQDYSEARRDIKQLGGLGYKSTSSKDIKKLIEDTMKQSSLNLPYRERVDVYPFHRGSVLTGMLDRGALGTVGGGVEEGETPEEAALRELHEETGYRGKNIRPTGLDPVIYEWPKTDLSKLSPEQRDRRSKYRGSLTHFFATDIMHPREVAPDPSHMQDLRFRRPHTILRLLDKVKDKSDFDRRHIQYLSQFLKRSDYVEGIPDKGEYGDLSKLRSGELLDFIRQRHFARRAGLHEDVRFGDKDRGLYSWAVRKGLPDPGVKHLAARQPLHSHEYGKFEGEIPSGYGAGKVEKAEEGKILITKSEPNKIHFSIAHRRNPAERFVLMKPESFGKKHDWLLMNTTPTKPINYDKIPYKTIPSEKVESVLKDLQPGHSVQPKIDGAASLVSLMGDKIETLSYRKSKLTGGPLPYTEKIFHKEPDIQIPKQYRNSVLRAETFATHKDKATTPQALSGLLNSSLAKSITDQRAKNYDLKNLVFDVHKLNKKPTTDINYQDRLQTVRDFLGSIKGPDADFVRSKMQVPEEAYTPPDALALWNRIKNKQHPLTQEGIILHGGKKPAKAKLFSEDNAYIREFTQGLGKYTGRGVGGFRYSHTPTGPLAGEVGSGLDDQMREEFYNNPDQYIGRSARIKHTGKLPSQALFQPVFLGLNEDK